MSYASCLILSCVPPCANLPRPPGWVQPTVTPDRCSFLIPTVVVGRPGCGASAAADWNGWHAFARLHSLQEAALQEQERQRQRRERKERGGLGLRRLSKQPSRLGIIKRARERRRARKVGACVQRRASCWPSCGLSWACLSVFLSFFLPWSSSSFPLFAVLLSCSGVWLVSLS